MINLTEEKIYELATLENAGPSFVPVLDVFKFVAYWGDQLDDALSGVGSMSEEELDMAIFDLRIALTRVREYTLR